MTDAFTYVFVRMQNAVAGLQNHMAELREREDGQAMVEYALILALVSIAAIVALTTLGNKVKNAFNSINNALP
jgi:pilus assembly protein Flp/PilA